MKIENLVFLTNTDTTIGFVSKSKKSLDIAKKRAPNKVYIKALPSFKNLSKRVPQIHKKRVRRAKKTTFILSSNFSFRVIKDKSHNLLLNRLKYAFTSSANESNRGYDYNYAYENADIIVTFSKDNILINNKPSSIYKLTKLKLVKIR